MSENLFRDVTVPMEARALTHNISEDEKRRRAAMELNKDFFYGDQAKSVKTPDAEVDPVTINFMRGIVKKRASLLYNTTLVREIVGPRASISALETVYGDNDIDCFMYGVDLYSELTGSVLVFPERDDGLDGGIKLKMYDGSMISALAKEDDPNQAEALSIITVVDRLVKTWKSGEMQAERVLMQQIWTETHVIKWEGQSQKMREANELGFLPFVNIRSEKVEGQYLGHAPSSAARMLNGAINQMMTDLAYTVKLQSATPIALEGYQSGEQMKINPGRAIALPVGASATVLDLNPKISETMEVIRYLEDKTYETSSVPQISVVGDSGAKGQVDSPASGRALLVRWAPLMQVANEKAIQFEKSELRLANMILRVLGLDPIESINVDYPGDRNLPLSADEEVLERDVEMGLKTPAQELQRRNPDLTDEEAKSKVKENLSESEKINLDKPNDT